jgi:DNA-binding NarL/FixJ family response regulator
MGKSLSGEIKVAIIEDSASFNEILTSMVELTEGLHCSASFADAESACTGIVKNPPDVVLVDIGLPGMNGIECIQFLKSQVPRLQFLILTIKDQEEEIFGALQAGANGYLLKSASPDEITAGIKELYDGGAPMSTSIARKVVNYFQESKDASRPTEDVLTTREKEVLHLLSRGKYYKEIAAELFISIETVKSHCHNIYEKLHVSSKTEAINKYYGRFDT